MLAGGWEKTDKYTGTVHDRFSSLLIKMISEERGKEGRGAGEREGGRGEGREQRRRENEKEGGMYFELVANLVGADLVPVDLHAGDGEGTTEGLEGGVTHGGVGGVQGGVEGLLGLDDGLEGIRGGGRWVTSYQIT